MSFVLSAAFNEFPRYCNQFQKAAIKGSWLPSEALCPSALCTSHISHVSYEFNTEHII